MVLLDSRCARNRICGSLLVHGIRSFRVVYRAVRYGFIVWALSLPVGWMSDKIRRGVPIEKSADSGCYWGTFGLAGWLTN